MRQVRKPLFHLQVFLTLHNRVYEKTAGITLHLGIGQFLLAYVDNGLSQLFCIRFLYAVLFQFLAKSWLFCFRQIGIGDQLCIEQMRRVHRRFFTE